MSAEYKSCEVRRRYVSPDETMRYPEIVFSHEYGHATTHFDTDANSVRIDWIEVARTERRRGVGKTMLRAIDALAKELEVQTITATIISRESLEAMRHVFGDENLRVRQQGDFVPMGFTSSDDIHRTSATLRVERYFSHNEPDI